MNVVVIVVAVVACLFGGIMADDPVAVVFAGSTGSTGGLLGCKPLATSSSSGPKVRFQAVRTGGVEYTRVRVPSGRMNFSDVTVMNLGSLTFLECVKAANKKKINVFSFENGKCVGYNVGEGICPCTKGDLVLYRAKSAIRVTSSAKPLTVAKERAGAAPLSAGYTRKIIYPMVSMTGNNFMKTSLSCEAVLANPPPFSFRPMLLHTVNGECYYTFGFSKYPCDSCGGTATDVIVMEPPANQTYLLSNCGGSVAVSRLPYSEFAAGAITVEMLYSHEGYGCIPYPDPVSDDNCDITLFKPTVEDNRMLIWAQPGEIDIDTSPGKTCDGDELYVDFSYADGSPCLKNPDYYDIIYPVNTTATIRFQRKPAYKKNSVNKGFALDAVVFFY